MPGVNGQNVAAAKGQSVAGLRGPSVLTWRTGQGPQSFGGSLAKETGLSPGLQLLER